MRRPSLSRPLLVGLAWLFGGFSGRGALVRAAEAAQNPPAPGALAPRPPVAPAATGKAPAQAATKPAIPAANTGKPAIPTANLGKPAVPATTAGKPAAPATKPATPAGKPVGAVAPVGKPAAPAVRPAGAVAKASPVGPVRGAKVAHGAAPAARGTASAGGAKGGGATRVGGGTGSREAGNQVIAARVPAARVEPLPQPVIPRVAVLEADSPGVAMLGAEGSAADESPRPAGLPEPALKADAATGYMALSGEECEAELTRRGVLFTSAMGEAPGVDRPIRFGGALRGVETHEPGPASMWHRSSSEILDCRLALAIDDFSAILAKHGVVEVLQVSLYRKNARIAGRGTPSQHAAGRALDVAVLVKADGTRLDIRRDWHSVIGDRSCGVQATPPREASAAALELRAIACDAAAAGIFHLMLTPSFNRDHHDHLHLDIEPRRAGTEIK